MQQISESVKVLFGNENRRFMSPLFIPFIFFWMYFNWEAILYMLLESDLSVLEKIEFVEKKYSNSGNNFWKPLALSIVTLFLAPFIVMLQNISKSFFRLGEAWAEDEVKKK